MVHGFIRGLVRLGAFVNRLQRTMQFPQLGFDAIGLGGDASQFGVELILGVLQKGQGFLGRSSRDSMGNTFGQLFRIRIDHRIVFGKVVGFLGAGSTNVSPGAIWIFGLLLHQHNQSGGRLRGFILGITLPFSWRPIYGSLLEKEHPAVPVFFAAHHCAALPGSFPSVFFCLATGKFLNLFRDTNAAPVVPAHGAEIGVNVQIFIVICPGQIGVEGQIKVSLPIQGGSSLGQLIVVVTTSRDAQSNISRVGGDAIAHSLVSRRPAWVAQGALWGSRNTAWMPRDTPPWWHQSRW